MIRRAKLTKLIQIVIMIGAVFFLTSCNGVLPDSQIQNENSKVEEIMLPGIENKAEINAICLDVPYQKFAGKDWCLPATGSMTLDYFGLSISQQELAQKIINPDGLGDIYKMVRFAKDLGFEAFFKVLTVEQIENYLIEEIPLIVIQEYKESNPLAHARVVTGFDSDKKEFTINDPTIGQGYTLSYVDFMNLNLTANPKYTMAIVITPKEV